MIHVFRIFKIEYSIFAVSKNSLTWKCFSIVLQSKDESNKLLKWNWFMPMQLISIMNAAKNAAWLTKSFDFFTSMKSIQIAFAYLKLSRRVRFFSIILTVFKSAESSFFFRIYFRWRSTKSDQFQLTDQNQFLRFFFFSSLNHVFTIDWINRMKNKRKFRIQKWKRKNRFFFFIFNVLALR